MDIRIIFLACLCVITKVHAAAVNEACTQDSDCTDAQNVCQELFCKVQSGGACTGTDVSKCVKFTTCTNDQCTCKTGSKVDGGKCMQVYDATCTVATVAADCTTPLPNSECTGTPLKCKCVAGYKMSSETPPTCVMKVIGDTCTESTDCMTAVEHSECMGSVGAKTCKCMNGYTGATTACTLVYNTLACGTDNTVCTNVLKYGKCSAQTCMCDDTAVVEDNICKLKIDGDCSAAGYICPNNAGCTATTCSCNDNYVKENDKCAVENSGMAVMASLMLIVTALASVLLR